MKRLFAILITMVFFLGIAGIGDAFAKHKKHRRGYYYYPKAKYVKYVAPRYYYPRVRYIARPYQLYYPTYPYYTPATRPLYVRHVVAPQPLFIPPFVTARPLNVRPVVYPSWYVAPPSLFNFAFNI